MAKINARGARQVGPTIFTTRLNKYSGPDDDSDWAVRYESWRLRSDGAVQRRIITATDHRTGSTVKINSAFTNVASIPHGPAIKIETLRAWLIKRGYTITKEA